MFDVRCSMFNVRILIPMQLLRSTSLNPSDNIALEEFLLNAESDGVTLLFWQSRPSLILGKNQNPWRECNLDYCREHDIQIARRFTGGGCVYQDEGNLNYAVIMDRDAYCMCPLLDAIAVSFQAHGIPADRILENSLGIAGRKFSGHAFCYRKDRVLHHGTMLLNANLNHLTRSLHPDEVKLTSHAVASRRAEVCNLQDVDPTLTVSGLQSIVAQAVSEYLEEALDQETTISTETFQRLEERPKYASNDWIFGQTPAFTVEGEDGVQIRIRKMKIESIDGVSGVEALLGRSLNGLDLSEWPSELAVLEPFIVRG